MSATAVILVLISASVHAGWNLVSKTRLPDSRFFLYANSFGTLLLLPVLLFRSASIRYFPSAVWPLIGATGFCQAVYYFSLAGAYRSGDLSVVYPMARSLPVLMTVLMNILLGRISQISSPAIVGMTLIAGGGLLLPLQDFTRRALSKSARISIAFAFLAAAGTTGYSMIDDTALRNVRSILETKTDVFLDTLLYLFLAGAASSFWLFIFSFIAGDGRKRQNQRPRGEFGPAVLAGAGIFLAYALVLLSLAYARNVSYIVAFRQVSIPLGALLGFTILKEPRHPPRIVGSLLIFGGLVLVALG